jgi:hypothetical protein
LEANVRVLPDAPTAQMGKDERASGGGHSGKVTDAESRVNQNGAPEDKNKAALPGAAERRDHSAPLTPGNVQLSIIDEPNTAAGQRRNCEYCEYCPRCRRQGRTEVWGLIARVLIVWSLFVAAVAAAALCVTLHFGYHVQAWEMLEPLTTRMLV